MTQLIPTPNRDQNRRPRSGDLKWLPLLLFPVVCCALPGLLVALAAASAAALGAGIAVVAGLAVAAGVLFMRYRRRCRAQQCLSETTTARPAPR